MLSGQCETPTVSFSHTAHRTFNVNTLASFWTLKAFLPGMIQMKKGHIVRRNGESGLVQAELNRAVNQVTVSSVLGMFGVPQLCE